MNGAWGSWGALFKTKRYLWTGAGILLCFQIHFFHGLRHDDAYITYRYGQNLATGKGLVFNPGERIMASTSPGHSLLSAGVYAMAGKERLPSLMSAMGCLGWTAQSIGLFLLFQKALGKHGALYVALCVALGLAWSHRFVALETNLVAGLVVWCIYAAVQKSCVVAACLCALAGFMRPDAFLLILPLGYVCLRNSVKTACKAALFGFLLSAPWYLFSWIYYGTVLPNSAPAKFGHMSFFQSLGLVAHCVALNPVSPRFILWVGSWWYSLLAMLVLGCAASGAFFLWRRDPRLWVLPGSGILYFIAYVLFRARDGTEWHVYPLILLVGVLLVVLVLSLTQGFKGRSGWIASGCNAMRIAVLTLLPILILGRTLRHAAIYPSAFFYGARDEAYRNVSKYLLTHAQPADVVVVKEIGTIAYWSELSLIDLAGLATEKPYQELMSRTQRPRWLVWLPPYGKGPPPVEPVYHTVSRPVASMEPGLAHESRVEAMVLSIDDRFWALWEPALALAAQE